MILSERIESNNGCKLKKIIQLITKEVKTIKGIRMMNKMTDESIKVIDPNILLSIINTKLRDQYSSLNQLCDDLDISESGLIDKLRLIDRQYDSSSNQFK